MGNAIRSRTSLAAGLAIALAGCGDKQATISLDYATTSAGITNPGNYEIGQLFLWEPALDQARDLTVVSAPVNAQGFPGATRTARDVRGFVAGANFSASPAQRGDIEARVSSETSIVYSNFTVETSPDTRGAMADMIDRDPGNVAEAWQLQQAIDQGGIYYVVVHKTLLTEAAELRLDDELSAGATVDVGSVDGGISISFEDSSLLNCDGAQRCFFDIRIYEPFINAAGNFDFRPPLGVQLTPRMFVEDWREQL